MMPALLALGLSGLPASAWQIIVTVSCPNGTPIGGVEVCAENGAECQTTDAITGSATLDVSDVGTYNVCITKSTLPQGATYNSLCQTVVITDGDIPGEADFTVDGSFCGPPPQGLCWMTGGGTIGGGKKPDYSYGGVVYPGCSPTAAGGGNWNVVRHIDGAHFKGQNFVVDGCSGVPTRSPKVTLNIIDFHGDGIFSGADGKAQPVTFVGRVVDVKEPGHDSDMIYLAVTLNGTIVLQIGNSAQDPQVCSTGNLQIHQSSCGK
jgi:hypothetical protein